MKKTLFALIIVLLLTFALGTVASAAPPPGNAAGQLVVFAEYSPIIILPIAYTLTFGVGYAVGEELVFGLEFQPIDTEYAVGAFADFNLGKLQLGVEFSLLDTVYSVLAKGDFIFTHEKIQVGVGAGYLYFGGVGGAFFLDLAADMRQGPVCLYGDLNYYPGDGTLLARAGLSYGF